MNVPGGIEDGAWVAGAWVVGAWVVGAWVAGACVVGAWVVGAWVGLGEVGGGVGVVRSSGYGTVMSAQHRNGMTSRGSLHSRVGRPGYR